MFNYMYFVTMIIKAISSWFDSEQVWKKLDGWDFRVSGEQRNGDAIIF